MNKKVEGSTFKIMTKALCIIRRVGYAIEILNCMIHDGFFYSKICSLIVRTLHEQEGLCFFFLNFCGKNEKVWFLFWDNGLF